MYEVEVDGRVTFHGDDALACYANVAHHVRAQLGRPTGELPAATQEWLDGLWADLDNGADLGPLTCYGSVVVREV